MDGIENECSLARLIWGIIKTKANKGYCSMTRLCLHNQIEFLFKPRMIWKYIAYFMASLKRVTKPSDSITAIVQRVLGYPIATVPKALRCNRWHIYSS